MAIIRGGTKQDEAPIGHAAAAPRHYKVNVWRDQGCRVHLAVAVTATARQLDGPCDSLANPPKMKKHENQDLWQSPQKMKKNESQNFMGVSISK